MNKAYFVILHLFLLPAFALTANDETNSLIEQQDHHRLLEQTTRKKCCNKKNGDIGATGPTGPQGPAGIVDPSYLSATVPEANAQNILPKQKNPTNIVFNLPFFPSLGITPDKFSEKFKVSEDGIYLVSWTLTTEQQISPSQLSLFINPGFILVGRQRFGENDVNILSGTISLSLQAGDNIGLQAKITQGTGSVLIIERLLSITKVAPAPIQ